MLRRDDLCEEGHLGELVLHPLRLSVGRHGGAYTRMR
jgi:hypothetical protein